MTKKCLDCPVKIEVRRGKKKRCVDCQDKYKKEYYEKNKKQIKEHCKEWQEGHPGYQKKLCKEWREGHPRYQKEYYEKNKERIKEHCKECVEKKPERYWAKGTRTNHINRGFDMSDISIDCLENLAKRTKICRYCGIVINHIPHNGHKMNGLSLDRIDNKKGALLPGDVQIICRRCSIRKHEKTDKEFLEYLERKKIHLGEIS